MEEWIKDDDINDEADALMRDAMIRCASRIARLHVVMRSYPCRVLPYLPVQNPGTIIAV